QLVAREGRLGPHGDRVTEPDRARAVAVAAGALAQPPGVPAEARVPEVDVVAADLDERLQLGDLMQAEGPLDLHRAQVVAQVHEQEPLVDRRVRDLRLAPEIPRPAVTPRDAAG